MNRFAVQDYWHNANPVDVLIGKFETFFALLDHSIVALDQMALENCD
jgi:hypothetical protein